MVNRTTTTTTTAATAATTTTPIKKKKGRPSLVDLQNRALLQRQNQNPNNNNSPSNNSNNRRVRSTRRILNLPAHFLDGSDSDDDIQLGRNSGDSEPSDYDDDDNDDDDDDDGDERVQKKVKLVVQFPNKNAVVSQKQQKNEKSSKATDNIFNGTRRLLAGLEHGPAPTSTSTTPAITTNNTVTSTSTSTRLPDKKLLLLLLDKLQRKDTRGVFAEPVDPEELPDYNDIIEKPMDFETVRKKLLGGVYTMLEQLEDDVNLICTNAMQYNAPSTMFFRQARAIQELAKKEFEVLKQDGGLIEAPIKPRRGRPPGSKNLKKILESSLPDRSVTVSESSPDPTPASREEEPTKSGSYNLRKGPSLYRFPRSFDHTFDNSGYSASSSKWMSAKYGKKSFGSDESRRDTYFRSGETNTSHDPHSLAAFGGIEKELTAVGLATDHSYSRSLARFAADLGPVVWKIVSKKLTSVLPPGVEFGPGWVGEPKMLSTQLNYVSRDAFQSEAHQLMVSGFPSANFAAMPSASCMEKSVEPREFTSNVEWSSLKGVNSNGVMGPGSSMQIQHQNSGHPRINGISGSFGSSTQFEEAIARPTSSHSGSSFNNPSALDSSTTLDASRNISGMVSSESDLTTQGQGMPYWQNLSIQERWDHPYPVELNRGFQASSSKNSNLPIGSPPQLDLMLQL